MIQNGRQREENLGKSGGREIMKKRLLTIKQEMQLEMGNLKKNHVRFAGAKK